MICLVRFDCRALLCDCSGNCLDAAVRGAGPTGADGSIGPTGADGAPGRDGATGKDGLPGAQGEPGEHNLSTIRANRVGSSLYREPNSDSALRLPCTTARCRVAGPPGADGRLCAAGQLYTQTSSTPIADGTAAGGACKLVNPNEVCGLGLVT